MFMLYGVPGWGSAISEIMLTLAGEDYQFVNVEGFDQPGPQREQIRALNPLCQIPVLKTVNGEILTETAALALLLLDRCPDLAPDIGTPARLRFQRLLIWLNASLYPSFSYSDHPDRWLDSEGAQQQLRERVDGHRHMLYQWLENQLRKGEWTCGERMTLLDAYWPVMVRWRPGEAWFIANTPKLYDIVERMRALPELGGVLARNGLL